MIFQVTKTDIKRAVRVNRTSTTHCVVARAIRRKIPTARVGVQTAWCVKERRGSEIRLPLQVVRSIERYLWEQPLEPFTFTLTSVQVDKLRGRSRTSRQINKRMAK